MPPDSEVVSIADAFLNEMGIDKTGYGTPTVDSSWKLYYAQAESKADYWFPQQLNVQYPLIIDGKYVYYSDGRKEAMNVTVDVKSRRAVGVSPIYGQSFMSSDYEAETDATAMIEAASKGGAQPMYGEGAEKIVEVKLDEPEIAWYSYWSSLMQQVIPPSQR